MVTLGDGQIYYSSEKEKVTLFFWSHSTFTTKLQSLSVNHKSLSKSLDKRKGQALLYNPVTLPPWTVEQADHEAEPILSNLARWA